MFSLHETTNSCTYQNPCHMPGYAGYCPQVKFRHYGATFGNATAKCFQDRRTAELNTSVMTKPGVSKDGRDRFPTMYSNSPDHLLLTIAIKRGRWCNAKNYSLFNEHKRGREVKEFDKLAQNHRDYYMDSSGTIPREDKFVVPRKRPASSGWQSTKTTDFLRNDVKIKCSLSGKSISLEDKGKVSQGASLKMRPRSPGNWRDRALRDVYFEKR
ncbi:protein FAM166C B-like [Acropora millepora]|uniref:protein FAM166C B-like n=1 Tax=Acropora millepora TaxID=45264 RepID=UPI001CF2D905|nr:protein FAM166C B-like [Acropora millepora]